MRSRFTPRMSSLAGGLLALVALTPAPPAVVAQPAGNPWHAFSAPSPGAAQSFGGYSAGCVAGAHKLPLTGTGYQVTRPRRKRVFGHAVLVDFIRELSRSAHERELGPLYIGDLGQARGGPAPSGHASHQSGLDVDIWYGALLPNEARTRPVAYSVVDLEQERVNERWSPRIASVLRLAASDARVARIFVHPAIKQALCDGAGSDRAYLSRLRPWFGHDDHFHVRLACPADSPRCEPQALVPPGDGCSELVDWIGPAAAEKRKQERSAYQSRVGAVPQLPPECNALLE
jgi:penicillin-insensitive murein endopeptidase